LINRKTRIYLSVTKNDDHDAAGTTAADCNGGETPSS
jgi:hypothetical protein